MNSEKFKNRVLDALDFEDRVMIRMIFKNFEGEVVRVEERPDFRVTCDAGGLMFEVEVAASKEVGA